MPKDVSGWTKLKRSKAYIQAFTIGIDDRIGGGKIYHQKTHELFKNKDDAYRKNHNRLCKDEHEFTQQWLAFDGDKLVDSNAILNTVKGYFRGSPVGKVNISIGKGRKIKNVELCGLNGSWTSIWSA